MRAYTTPAGSLPKVGAVLLLLWGPVAASARGGETATPRDEVARGKELFLREWLPDDPRAHGGDGLGPVYNDSSCVACHNMGAPGGAGPSSKDVPILSAFPPEREAGLVGIFGVVGNALLKKNGDLTATKRVAAALAGPDVEGLARFHA